MNQDNVNTPDAAERIRRALEAISVGSYLFQSRLGAELGLHATDLKALHVLGGAARGLTAGEIAATLGLTSGATTTLIDRLEGKGFVVRTRDNADRRKVVVRLRPSGLTPLREKYRPIEESIARSIAQREGVELNAIADFLEDVAGGQ